MKEQLENKLKEILNKSKKEIKELIKQAYKLQENTPPKKERGSVITDSCGCWYNYDCCDDCILHRIENFLGLD